jgi:hypothetical protein
MSLTVSWCRPVFIKTKIDTLRVIDACYYNSPWRVAFTLNGNFKEGFSRLDCFTWLTFYHQSGTPYSREPLVCYARSIVPGISAPVLLEPTCSTAITLQTAQSTPPGWDDSITRIRPTAAVRTAGRFVTSDQYYSFDCLLPVRWFIIEWPRVDKWTAILRNNQICQGVPVYQTLRVQMFLHWDFLQGKELT